MNRKHDFREHLTKEIAQSLAAEHLSVSETADGVLFDPTPVSVGRIEVGWLFEFAPVRKTDDNGSKVYHYRCVVDDIERRVHTVGTAGVGRVMDRIRGGEN